LHTALNLHYPKSGVCEECGAEAETEYSLIHGRQVSRRREDYRELCKPCHHGYDTGGERSLNAKLTEANVRDLRVRFDDGQGEPIEVLAREYGVSPAAAYRAATRKSWRHVA
jgi:hypothetical protein